ncbi:RNA polymerase sigma factor [Streptomyces venetus]|uniref:RNA polymerase sigma factor n=1 Tax=Streptomyces venetus TaxID=1701086 RepID=UPI003C2E294C
MPSLAGGDDGGTPHNATISARLVKGRRYVVRVRLYSAWGSGETAVMCWYQTAWFRFAQHLGRIREPGKAGAWLAATARNECLKAIRSSRRVTLTDDPQVLDRASEDGTPEQSLLDSEEAAAQSERVRRLWQEFEELGERCRQLLRVLMASPPPSYQDVSAALGIAVGSIGPLRQRCLRRLRARLEARGAI